MQHCANAGLSDVSGAALSLFVIPVSFVGGVGASKILRKEL